MLLLVDHLALRARNYEYLIHLFQEWEVGGVCDGLHSPVTVAEVTVARVLGHRLVCSCHWDRSTEEPSWLPDRHGVSECLCSVTRFHFLMVSNHKPPDANHVLRSLRSMVRMNRLFVRL